MITIMKESSDKALAVQATEKLTNQDYVDIWIPALIEKMEKNGKINCVFYMDEKFEGWEMKAMWQDAKFGFAHRNDFAKIAMVGGPKWVEWSAEVGKHLVSAEFKSFEAAQLDEALKWVND